MKSKKEIDGTKRTQEILRPEAGRQKVEVLKMPSSRANLTANSSPRTLIETTSKIRTFNCEVGKEILVTH
jgi:hypothetical protein